MGFCPKSAATATQLVEKPSGWCVQVASKSDFLWSLDEYWYYAIFTLFMLVIFECTVAYQQLRSLERLRETLRPPYYVLTYRKKKWVPILTDNLVAGDFVSMTSRPLQLQSSMGQIEDSHHQIPCDLLMIKGSAVVNESMLTGESVPQIKEAVDPAQYPKGTVLDVDEPSFRRHIVFGGTFCVDQSSGDRTSKLSGDRSAELNNVSRPPDSGCICYVLRTGFESQVSQITILSSFIFRVI